MSATPAHLLGQRRTLLASTLLASAVGRIPPARLGRLLATTVRQSAVRRLARAHRVDLDADAVRELATAGPGARTAKDFARATLVDHYLQRRHEGAALDEAGARAVREAIEGALLSTHGLAARMAGRALTHAARGAAQSSLRLADRLGAGALVRLLAPEKSAMDAESIDDLVAAQSEKGPLARAARAAADELDAVGGAWIEDLVTAFDTRLAAGAARGRR